MKIVGKIMLFGTGMIIGGVVGAVSAITYNKKNNKLKDEVIKKQEDVLNYQSSEIESMEKRINEMKETFDFMTDMMDKVAEQMRQEKQSEEVKVDETVKDEVKADETSEDEVCATKLSYDNVVNINEVKRADNDEFDLSQKIQKIEKIKIHKKMADRVYFETILRVETIPNKLPKMSGLGIEKIDSMKLRVVFCVSGQPTYQTVSAQVRRCKLLSEIFELHQEPMFRRMG